MAEHTEKKRRLESGRACDSCRQKKHRCNATRPQCSNCQIRMIPCFYGSSVVNTATIKGLKNPTESVHKSPRPTSKHTSTSIDPGSKKQFSTNAKSTSLLDHDRSSTILAAQEILAPQVHLDSSSTFASTLAGSSHEPRENHISNQKCQSSIWVNDPVSNYGHMGVLSSPEYCFELPDRILADSLVDAYFSRIHRLYPFLHEGSFRTEYEMMWEQSPSQEYSRLSWFGVLNMVFAHGCEFSSMVQHKDVLTVAVPFVARSNNLILSQNSRSSTLETIQSLLLMCYYLQGTVEVDKAWDLVGLMIRTAIDLKLHLNPSIEKYLPIERELRKRVWWGCFIIDRTLSMKFGRPPTLRVEDGNVELPLQVDDQYITNDCCNLRQPISKPSFTAFFVTTIRVSHIVYDMLTSLYLRGLETRGSNSDTKLQNSSTEYSHLLSKVILLDGQLQSWWEDAPLHLTQEPTDREGCWAEFQSQRVVLKIRFLYIRLLLHRQSFLDFCKDQIKGEFCQSIAISSARICVDCARQTIELINNSYPRQQLNSIWYNAQYVFTSMCVLCILERMNEDKRAMLNCHAQGQKSEDYHNMGFKFLKSVSMSNLLAAQYVSVLQQLHGVHTVEESIYDLKNSNISADREDISFRHQHLTSLNSQEEVQRRTLGNLDLFSQTALDFDGVNDHFCDTGLSVDSVVATIRSHSSSSYVGWE